MEVLTRNNTITGTTYLEDPTIFAWELINEPRCVSDPSGRTLQAWIEEMAGYVKSIDRNHLLEVGLEGFYGDSMEERKRFNPGYGVGSDFIANNLDPHIDFSTIHLYPDQWIPGSDVADQFAFLQAWIQAHADDAGEVIGKPLLIAEFGRPWRCSEGGSLSQRDDLYQMVYSDIYASAAAGGPCAGALFWQLLVAGMDGLRDGYEVIFSESPSTASIIYRHSRRLSVLNMPFTAARAVAVT
ncbi:Mannan endo-1,4-beta-mannosidase 1 [Apostasia shenzhenica]|uniref:mannan endo-1,4-beta-mannosidase n=1 Tax=Apostasia shenzhenica TaxID=1088818 RepID=A0A2I0A016_9ASPA|nr:Mannan endo-1,4-beta-mannosidase 1 [Apostasia shenzhenica]